MRRFMLFVLSLSIAGVAAAQGHANNSVHYRWVDAGGLAHFSDSLTQDAIKYGYDVISSDGMVLKHVQRELTPSERAAAEKQAAADAAQQHVINEQKQQDLQLLNTYPDEDALKSQQAQMLESLDEQMSTTRVNLHSQDAALNDLLNRAADDERAKKLVPKALTEQINAQRNVVANERALLDHQKASRESMMRRQAQELEHFRTLKAAEKTNRGY